MNLSGVEVLHEDSIQLIGGVSARRRIECTAVRDARVTRDAPVPGRVSESLHVRLHCKPFLNADILPVLRSLYSDIAAAGFGVCPRICRSK